MRRLAALVAAFGLVMLGGPASTPTVEARPPAPFQQPTPDITPTPQPDPPPVPLIIDGPSVAEVYRMVDLALAGPPVEDAEWDAIYGPDISYPVDIRETDPAGRTAVMVGPPGTYRVSVMATVAGKNRRAVKTVVIGVPSPPTPVPVPPGPEPGPTPQPPTPGKLARVLAVYESTAPMTRGQLAMLNSAAVVEKLNAICPLDGRVKAWRFWDKDIDASKETPGWQTALSLAKTDPTFTQVPRLFIFTDKDGQVASKSYPFPGTEAEFLGILSNYAGD